nr:hypothetical protein [Scopulibacillus daqui]
MAEIFGKVTPEEYAKLSSLAYQDENKINKELKKFKIGKVRLRKISGEIVHHYKSGLDAVIFQIGTSNNYIIAFRGTESNFITSFKDAYRDVKNDTTGVLGIPALSLTGNVWGSPDLAITGVKRGYSSSQDRDADKFIKKVKRQLGDNINLTFTGHSLGGWLADNQADKYNTTAVTFNAPRYTPGSKKEFLKNNNQKMVNFRVEGDLISEKHKKPINMKYSPGINISVPNVALESGLKPHEINRSFRFDKRGNILIDSKQREISNDIKLTDTAKVKDDLISKKQLENIENRVINNRIYSNHNRVDEKYTNDLLSKVNQMISNLEKMDKFQNMGDRYIPEELNKEEIGNYAKKLIKLQLNKKQLEKEVNSNLYDQDPFINHEYIKNLEINKIHSFEKEITEIEAKIDDLKHNYHTNDEKILNELKGYKHELEQLLQRSQK